MSDQPSRGRPPTITPRPGEKSMLSVLVSPELKQNIIAAAAVSGRSLSAEAEKRLERSFIDQQYLDAAATLAWGANAPRANI